MINFKYFLHFQKFTLISILVFVFLEVFPYKTFGQKQVTHLVLFKLKPGILKTDKKYKEALIKLKELPRKISDIEDFSLGENFSQRPIAYDFGLYVVFPSRKKLQNYLTHPAHMEAVEAWKEIADWNIVDYENFED